MAEKHLIKRGNGWAFKLAVPADLRGHFKSSKGKPLDHIVLGLRTDSLTAARIRRDQLLGEWRTNFDRARKGLELSLAEIEEQAREIYLSHLEAMADAAERGKAPQVEGDDASTPQEREINALDIALEQFLEAREDDDFSLIGIDLAAIQRRTKVTLDPAGKTYRILCEAIMAAHIAALTGRIKLLRGEVSEPPATFLGSYGIDPVTLQPVARKRLAPHKEGGQQDALRFSEAVSLWMAELKRDPDAASRPSTLVLYERICAIFDAAEHGPTLEAVTRKVAADFLTKIGAERKLSNRSLKQYAITLSMVWKWAKKTGRFYGENPFADQTFKEPKDTGYLPYTDDELKKLFAGFSKPYGPLAWISLIGLYSGMRLNEIAQLWVHDIKQEHGIWVFDLQEGDGQILKTRSATRKVPIHSKLIEAGLLEYASKLPKNGRLFPSLRSGGPDNKLSWYLSQQFTNYRREVGVTRDRLTFHSLRKNFGTALDRAGVLPSDREAVLGHSRGFSLDVYSTGPGLKRLKEMVEAVSFAVV